MGAVDAIVMADRRPHARDVAWLRRPWISAGLGLAALGSVALYTHLDVHEGPALAATLVLPAVVAAISLLWAAIWSLVGRVLVHEWRLAAHVAIISIYLLVDLPVTVAMEYMQFSFSLGRIFELLAAAVEVAVTTVLLVAHLRQVSSSTTWKQIAIAALASLTLNGGLYLVAYGQTGWFPDHASFPSALKPVPARYLPREPVAQFLDRLDSLRDEVDGLARDDR